MVQARPQDLDVPQKLGEHRMSKTAMQRPEVKPMMPGPAPVISTARLT
ncbi:GNAT family N-acetyltransferase, partial [Rhizobium ruizarguesonis]